jgi:hypothetical protein
MQLSPSCSPSWLIALGTSIVLCAGLAASAVLSAGANEHHARESKNKSVWSSDPCDGYTQQKLYDLEGQLNLEVAVLEEALRSLRRTEGGEDAIRDRRRAAFDELDMVKARLDDCADRDRGGG